MNYVNKSLHVLILLCLIASFSSGIQGVEFEDLGSEIHYPDWSDCWKEREAYKKRLIKEQKLKSEDNILTKAEQEANNSASDNDSDKNTSGISEIDSDADIFLEEDISSTSTSTPNQEVNNSASSNNDSNKSTGDISDTDSVRALDRLFGDTKSLVQCYDKSIVKKVVGLGAGIFAYVAYKQYNKPVQLKKLYQKHTMLKIQLKNQLSQKDYAEVEKMLTLFEKSGINQLSKIQQQKHCNLVLHNKVYKACISNIIEIRKAIKRSNNLKVK